MHVGMIAGEGMEEEGTTPPFVNNGEADDLLLQMEAYNRVMGSLAIEAPPAQIESSAPMIEGPPNHEGRVVRAVPRMLSTSQGKEISMTGSPLDTWSQFTPPAPAQVTFEVPLQTLIQMGQEANCFKHMGEMQTNALHWIAQLEHRVMCQLTGKISKEEMEVYLQEGLQEVDNLRQHSEAALTQVTAWVRAQLTLIEGVCKHVAWLHTRTENFYDMVQKYCNNDQEPKFNRLIEEVTKHSRFFYRNFRSTK